MGTFCDYVGSVPDELLAFVTEEYVWLAGLGFELGAGDEFRRRREWCLAECVRRGLSVVSPFAA